MREHLWRQAQADPVLKGYNHSDLALQVYEVSRLHIEVVCVRPRKHCERPVGRRAPLAVAPATQLKPSQDRLYGQQE